VRYPKNGLPIIESVNTFGASSHPESKHYRDQETLFQQQQLKPMTLDKAAVLRSAERVYHPMGGAMALPMVAPMPAPVAAPQDQPKHEGCLIYTLGKDTTAIGNYALNGLDFSITVVDLTGPAVVSTLSGTCFPNGELQHAEGAGYKPLIGKDSQLIYSYKLDYRQDTTWMKMVTCKPSMALAPPGTSKASSSLP